VRRLQKILYALSAQTYVNKLSEVQTKSRECVISHENFTNDFDVGEWGQLRSLIGEIISRDEKGRNQPDTLICTTWLL